MQERERRSIALSLDSEIMSVVYLFGYSIESKWPFVNKEPHVALIATFSEKQPGNLYVKIAGLRDQ